MLKAKELQKDVILVTDERKADWWWKLKDGRMIGPRQELIEEIKIHASVDFHMYSSERFLTFGQTYLKEQIDQKALDEIQTMQLELKQNLVKEYENHLSKLEKDLEELSIRRKLDNINAELLKIEKQQEQFRGDSLNSNEVQEYVHSLSILATQLEEKKKDLINEYEQFKIKDKIVDFFEQNFKKKYSAKYRFIKDVNDK